MADDAAREILIRGTRAVARAASVAAGLDAFLEVIAEQLDIESAVIVVADGEAPLAIIASTALPGAAAAALNQALQNPAHPIARTVAEPVPTFDVLPTAPGGPALRSHLPIAVARDGSATVLGVLAVAHERPMDAQSRQLLEAAADLAAVAMAGDKIDHRSVGG